MPKINIYFLYGATFFLLSFLIPSPTFSAENGESIHTIQIVSHFDLKAAQKQYTDIIEKFDKKEIPYLRIEKIGKYYALRLGKFVNKSEAKALHRTVKSRMPSSFIIKAYYIEDRIEQVYLPERALEEEIQETRREEPEVTAPEPVPPDVPTEEIIAEISRLVRDRNYESALEIAQKQIKKHPEHPELNAWYGTVLIKNDNPEMALQYMRNAVRLSPSTADYHNGLGYCFYYLEQHDKAIESFTNTLSIDPEHIDALAGLGLAYTRNGNTGKAMDAYRRLRDHDPASADKLLGIIKDSH